MSGHDMGDMSGHDMNREATPGDHAQDKKPQAPAGPKTIYTCPMHPEVRQDRPGKCPKCAMKLVPEKKPPPAGEHGGHP